MDLDVHGRGEEKEMSLTRVAAAGVKWTGVASALTTGLLFVQLAIMARLLRPEDFGLMAMVMVAIGFAQAFADMGISNAIIHRQDVSREQLSSLYWLNMIAGVAVFTLVVVATPLAAWLFREPRLTELMAWSALAFLITPLGHQFQVLLQKNLRFEILGSVEVGAAFVGAVTAVGSALAGQGVYSLVWGQLALATVKSLSLLAIGWRDWRPGLRLRAKDLQGYLGFGLYQMAQQIANYVSTVADQMLIGALLGAQTLGYYNLAFNLVIQPVSRLNPILTRVALPVFAKIQNERDRLANGFLTLQRVVAVVNFPLLVGVAVVAPVFVPTVLGEQWLPSISLIQILAFVAMIRSIGNTVGSLLLAKGRADLGFYYTLLTLFAQIPAVYLGAQYGGAQGVAFALLLMQVIFFWANYVINVQTLLGSCLRGYVASVSPALVTSCLMGLAVAGLSYAAGNQGWAMLSLQVLVGIVLYPMLNWLLYRDQFRRVVDLIGAARA